MTFSANRIKPVVFIGTTQEGLDAGRALVGNLDAHFVTRIWDQETFIPTASYLSSLLRLRDEIDYVVIMLTPDDVRESREVRAFVPRDNLIFELGLFIGAFGPERVVAMVPRERRPELPSDLAGITTLDYPSPSEGRWRNALVGVASKLQALWSAPPLIDDSVLEFPKRQIVVCSMEVGFSGDVPLIDVNRVIAEFESTVEGNLVLKIVSTGEFDHSVSALLHRARLSLRGPTAKMEWELPDRHDLSVGSGLILRILDTIGALQVDFAGRLDGLGDANPGFRAHYRSRVGLRVALTGGEAMRRGSEYVGSTMTEVSELRRQVALGGTIASLKLAPYVFMERLCAGEGTIDCRNVGWTAEGQAVWCTDRRLRRRTSKSVRSLNEVLEWAHCLYEEYDAPNNLPTLSRDDVISVFQLREKWESTFAAELASRLNDQNTDELTREIEETVRAMEGLLECNPNASSDPEWRRRGVTFHAQIAASSSAAEGEVRRRFSEWAYEFTRAVYGKAMVEVDQGGRREEPSVIDDHRNILALIRARKVERVRDQIKRHLADHYDRAHRSFLACQASSK